MLSHLSSTNTSSPVRPFQTSSSSSPPPPASPREQILRRAVLFQNEEIEGEEDPTIITTASLLSPHAISNSRPQPTTTTATNAAIWNMINQFQQLSSPSATPRSSTNPSKTRDFFASPPEKLQSPTSTTKSTSTLTNNLRSPFSPLTFSSPLHHHQYSNTKTQNHQASPSPILTGHGRKRRFDSDRDEILDRSSPTHNTLHIAKKRLTDVIEQGKQVVDLSYLGLDTLPEESISELRHVRYVTPSQTITGDLKLYLGGNALYSLPRELFFVTNLTVLSLRNNELEAIPPAICLLENLTELSLGGNRLTTLPGEIFLLKKLKNLLVTPNPFMKMEEVHSQLVSPPLSSLSSYSPSSSTQSSSSSSNPEEHRITLTSTTIVPLLELCSRAILPTYTSTSRTKRHHPNNSQTLSTSTTNHFHLRSLCPRQLLDTLEEAHASPDYECMVCQSPFITPAVVEIVWKKWGKLKDLLPFKYRFCKVECAGKDRERV